MSVLNCWKTNIVHIAIWFETQPDWIGVTAQRKLKFNSKTYTMGILCAHTLNYALASVANKYMCIYVCIMSSISPSFLPAHAEHKSSTVHDAYYSHKHEHGAVIDP